MALINKLIDLSYEEKKERNERVKIWSTTRLLHHTVGVVFYLVWINEIYTPIERNIDLFTWEQV